MIDGVSNVYNRCWSQALTMGGAALVGANDGVLAADNHGLQWGITLCCINS